MLGSANNWWLRSANNTTNFRYVNNNGNENNNNANNANGLVLGFNIGFLRESEYRNGNRNDVEGADDLPAFGLVNKQARGDGRTLLAWAAITVCRFHGRTPSM